MTTSACAERLVETLRVVRRTVAVAESLTGGAVTDALVAVPGASRCVRGGVIAYATDLKASLLDVPTEHLARTGPVDPDVALAMASGVRARLGADYGIATTGVAGPDPQDGAAPGTFHVAVVGPWGSEVRSMVVGGDRSAVRASARDAALELALGRVGDDAALHP
ncbi:MAG: CinA family protein [Cellulomonadaceae bacterium]|nr:CinA family protein [Cellulomonadaceae bacterium]